MNSLVVALKLIAARIAVFTFPFPSSIHKLLAECERIALNHAGKAVIKADRAFRSGHAIDFRA